jgi:hypothetical protein
MREPVPLTILCVHTEHPHTHTSTERPAPQGPCRAIKRPRGLPRASPSLRAGMHTAGQPLVAPPRARGSRAQIRPPRVSTRCAPGSARHLLPPTAGLTRPLKKRRQRVPIHSTRTPLIRRRKRGKSRHPARPLGRAGLGFRVHGPWEGPCRMMRSVKSHISESCRAVGADGPAKETWDMGPRGDLRQRSAIQDESSRADQPGRANGTRPELLVACQCLR